MRYGCRKFAIVLCHTLLYLGGAIPLLSHAVTPMEQAFIDGQAAAQSAASSASTNITNGTVATTVNSSIRVTTITAAQPQKRAISWVEAETRLRRGQGR